MQDSTLTAISQICKGMVHLAEMVREDTITVANSRDHIAVIKHYNHLRIATDSIKEAREALSKMEEDLSRVTVPEVMRENDVKTITVEGVGRVTVSSRISCSLVDKDTGFNWLREKGQGGIITETVNSSTLGAFARTWMEDGFELPADVFKVNSMTYTSITKAK